MLCVGTNAGTVFMFQITMPAEDKRETDRITCQLGNAVNEVGCVGTHVQHFILVKYVWIFSG